MFLSYKLYCHTIAKIEKRNCFNRSLPPQPGTVFDVAWLFSPYWTYQNLIHNLIMNPNWASYRLQKAMNRLETKSTHESSWSSTAWDSRSTGTSSPISKGPTTTPVAHADAEWIEDDITFLQTWRRFSEVSIVCIIGLFCPVCHQWPCPLYS